MDQIYQIWKYFKKKLHSNCRIWQGTVIRMCVNFRKKTECVLIIGNQISKVVYIKNWHVRHLRPGFPNDTGWAKVNPLTTRPPLRLPPLTLPFPPPLRPYLENAEISAGDIGDFGPGRNLRPTKTSQAEISGWAFTVNCSGINFGWMSFDSIWNKKRCTTSCEVRFFKFYLERWVNRWLSIYTSSATGRQHLRFALQNDLLVPSTRTVDYGARGFSLCLDIDCGTHCLCRFENFMTNQNNSKKCSKHF